MPQIYNASSFMVLLPDDVVLCCTVHVTRSVTFQQINISDPIQTFSISVNFKQPLTSGMADFGAPKLLVSVVWGSNLSGLGWSNRVVVFFSVGDLTCVRIHMTDFICVMVASIMSLAWSITDLCIWSVRSHSVKMHWRPLIKNYYKVIVGATGTFAY